MTALLLALLVHVRVDVTPAVAPDGSRWRVALNGKQLEPEEHGVFRGEVPEGYYLVWVSTEKGDTWWQRDTTIDRDKQIALDLRSRPVSGTVRFGDRPAAAKLVFGQAEGEHWTMESGPDGRFYGDLPVETRFRQWPVDIVTNGVRRTMQLDVHEDSFAVRLPRTSLHVRLNRAARISVCRSEYQCQEFQQASVDLSVDARTYDVYAETRDGQFAEAVVPVTEGEEREVKLQLAPPRIIYGVVLFNGAPVPDVDVYHREYNSFGRTDAEGRFSVPVPATLTMVELSVSKTRWNWTGPKQEVDVRDYRPIEIRLPEAPQLSRSEPIP